MSLEDVRCFFYIFTVPVSWRPYLSFGKPVPGVLCPSEDEEYFLRSRVLPMGFAEYSVLLAQRIHGFAGG